LKFTKILNLFLWTTDHLVTLSQRLPTPLTPKPSLPPSVTATQVEESYGLQSKGALPHLTSSHTPDPQDNVI